MRCNAGHLADWPDDGNDPADLRSNTGSFRPAGEWSGSHRPRKIGTPASARRLSHVVGIAKEYGHV